MSKTITRRGVLAGTVVAILVIAGGYVAAATLEGITTTQVGQNGGTFTGPTTTIFATNSGTTVTIQLVQATTSADSCNPTAVTWTSTTSTANVFASGTVGCAESALQWFEELSWNGVAVPPGAAQSDTIFIQVYDGTTYAYPQFTISDTGNVDSFTGTLNVYLAAGLVTGVTLPDAYSSISIAVSGT